MISYRLNNESGIIESVLDGMIEINDIVEHINNICRDTSLPAKLKILTDARKAVFNFNPKSLALLVDTMNRCENKHESIKEAILQDTPDITAYSFLYQKMLSSRKNHIFRIFSTEPAAVNWLKE